MRRRILLALGTLATLVLAPSCEKTPTDPDTDTPVADAIEVVSGDAQQAQVGTQLPDPLVVRVLDQDGQPLSGVAMEWTVESGGLSADGNTDAEGLASATWTLGAETGVQTVVVSAGSDLSVSFAATAVASVLATLTVSPEELTLEAVGATGSLTATGEDEDGNEVAVAVTWTSRDTDVAEVDGEGSVEATGAGETWVVAEADGTADSARVVVEVAEPEPTLDPALIGVWVETSLTYESAANPDQVVVEDDDYVALFTLRADGSFEFREEEAGASEVDGGTWSVLEDTLLLTATAADTTYRYAYTVAGGVVTAAYFEDEGYDFGNDGSAEATNTTSVWARQTELVGLSGSWASTSVVATNPADAGQEADLSADLQFSATFSGDGSYALVETETGAEPEAEGGWYVTAAGDIWLVDEVGIVERLTIQLDGDAATVTDLDEDFDFGDDGSVEGALLTIEFTRSTPGGAELDADLVGSWLGISYVLQNQNDAGQEVDVVVDEGWLMEVTFNDDGTFWSRDTYSTGEVGWHDTGTWYVRQDSIVLYSGREQDSVAIAYTKPATDLFSFTSENEEGWDFNGDETDEPTVETAVMARRIDAELVGTWVATSQIIIDATDPGTSVDFLAEGGSTTLTFHADGGAVLEQQEPDLNDQWDLDGQLLTFTGEYAAAGPFLWIRSSDGVDQLPFSYDGDSFTIVSEYSLDTGNPAEDVIETTTFVRQ